MKVKALQTKEVEGVGKINKKYLEMAECEARLRIQIAAISAAAKYPPKSRKELEFIFAKSHRDGNAKDKEREVVKLVEKNTCDRLLLSEDKMKGTIKIEYIFE